VSAASRARQRLRDEAERKARQRRHHRCEDHGRLLTPEEVEWDKKRKDWCYFCGLVYDCSDDHRLPGLEVPGTSLCLNCWELSTYEIIAAGGYQQWDGIRKYNGYPTPVSELASEAE
jgi:hypothetical protein